MLSPEQSVDLSELHEECGGAAVYIPGAEDVVPLVHAAARAQRHRGKDAWGIGVIDAEHDSYVYKEPVQVPETFPDEAVHAVVPASDLAISHVRWGTHEVSGAQRDEAEEYAKAQPFKISEGSSDFGVIAFNGQLANHRQLHGSYDSTVKAYATDGHLTALAAGIEMRRGALDVPTAVGRVLGQAVGGFAFFFAEGRRPGLGKNSDVAVPRRIHALRDPHGTRPLVYGSVRSNGSEGIAFASETIGLEAMGATFIDVVKPGQLATFDGSELTLTQALDAGMPKECSFEEIYFKHRDSKTGGILVSNIRKGLGRALGRERQPRADMIVPVPESAKDAGEGMHDVTGIPLVPEALIKLVNERTFISKGNRRDEIRRKFKVVPERVKGRIVRIADDSIVEGETALVLTEMFREAGATEVHWSLISPPYANPCESGVATGDVNKLIAHCRTPEEVAKLIGANSVTYLPAEKLVEALREVSPGVCTACFTGEYPFPLPDEVLSASRRRLTIPRRRLVPVVPAPMAVPVAVSGFRAS